MACVSMTMGDLYAREKDEDGFLYTVFASQEGFGFEVNSKNWVVWKPTEHKLNILTFLKWLVKGGISN